jgi:L-threonylcarbamoyladenylate synthase
MTELIEVDPASPEPEAIARAAACLRHGGLVAFPTETVYGLGAHALDRAAVRRLFAAKGRPANDPLIVHVTALADVTPLVSTVPASVQALATRFWPGPLTLVLPRSAAVPDEVTAGLNTVGVRVPAHPIARALIAAAGVPVAAPSANLFSRPSPTRAEHVLQDLDGRIDMVVDGGPTLVGVESTVLDLSSDVPTILRPGAVTLEMLREVLPRVEVRQRSAETASVMPSPGLLSKHYAPRAPLTLYEGEAAAVADRITVDARTALLAGKAVGVIAADEDVIGGLEGGPDGPPLRASLRVVRIGPARQLGIVASRLYAVLRELDAAEVDVILARAFPSDDGLGLAVQDRLRRAAGRIVSVP